jgi:acetyltransferase-like isoleucine patch superfamily enzyme
MSEQPSSAKPKVQHTLAPDHIVVEHTPRSALVVSIKRVVQAMFLVLVFPRLIIYRCLHKALGDRAFLDASESISRIPGLRGVYCRQAYYRRTLSRCGRDVYIGWLSTFSMHQASLGEGAYIGRRCSVGFADIGAKVMLADGVQILSGGREHGLAGEEGGTHQDQSQSFQRLSIGEGAWLGTNCVIMADVGAHSVVGAGAVVTRPIPDNCVAVGCPARVIKTLDADAVGGA